METIQNGKKYKSGIATNFQNIKLTFRFFCNVPFYPFSRCTLLDIWHRDLMNDNEVLYHQNILPIQIITIKDICKLYANMPALLSANSLAIYIRIHFG